MAFIMNFSVCCGSTVVEVITISSPTIQSTDSDSITEQSPASAVTAKSVQYTLFGRPCIHKNPNTARALLPTLTSRKGRSSLYTLPWRLIMKFDRKGWSGHPTINPPVTKIIDAFRTIPGLSSISSVPYISSWFRYGNSMSATIYQSDCIITSLPLVGSLRP